MATPGIETAEDVRRRGLEALRRELGVADMIRFLQQFETGHGDYTVERLDLLADLTLDDVLKGIEAQRHTDRAG